MTENELRNKVVNKAKSFLGTTEGSANHKYIIDTYNSYKPLPRGYAVKYWDAWCATFVSAIFEMCNLKDICYIECSCSQQIKQAKARNQYTTNKNASVKIGDIVFYDWGNNGSADHVGIVCEVVGNNIKVVEGNYSNTVKIRTINRYSSEVEGFAFPNFASKATSKPSNPTSNLLEVAKKVIQGKYGNGSVRKQKLEAEGYNYNQVQHKVNLVLKAQQVVQGKYGNGSVRKQKLEAEGYNYNEVQATVNELLK